MNGLTIAILGGLIAMIGWGTGDIIAKKSIDKIGSLETQFYVFILNCLFFLPLLFFNRDLPPFNFSTFFFLFLFSIFDLLGYLFLFKAYKIGKLSIINPITSTYAILSVFVSFILFQESFSFSKLLIVGIILLGIIFSSLDLKTLKDGFQWKDLSKGVPYAFLVFLIYGLYFPLWDKFIQRGGWVFLGIGGRLISSSILFLYFRFKKKGSLKALEKKDKSRIIIAAALYTLGEIGFNWGLNYSSETSIFSVISSSYPIITVLAAYFYLKERVAKNQYFGIALIIFGIIISSFI